MRFCITRTNSLADDHRKTIAQFFAAPALLSTAVATILLLPHPIYGIAEATGMADDTANADHHGSSGQTALWSGTIEKVSQRRMLGWGINQFSNSSPSKPRRFFHPHNFPLQLMFFGGIVSVLLTLLIVTPILLQWRLLYTKRENAAGVSAVIGLLVYALYDGILYFSCPTTIFLRYQLHLLKRNTAATVKIYRFGMSRIGMTSRGSRKRPGSAWSGCELFSDYELIARLPNV